MDLTQIRRGKTTKPPRVLIYGQEGIGKSSFAAGFPSPIFVPTEDGLDNIDCASFPTAQSFGEVLDALDALLNNETEFKTVVVDSLDWLERLIWDYVCKVNNVNSIEKIGYGKGYKLALTGWGDFLDRLTDLRDDGFAIVLVAHATTEQVDDPEVSGFQRFAPRLHKDARALISEWVDYILLATRELGSARGETSPRVIRTSASPSQVAKSRTALPETLPLSAEAFLSALNNSRKETEQASRLTPSALPRD